ncbi:FAD-binding oxidoreductase [Streptomyces sp. NPDC087856]|uniref:FAD-binding oxidoreductase n=1 Tax=Streptomyces sp. NPDC087856 TaxID=3365811 RepID=UPI0038189A8E
MNSAVRSALSRAARVPCALPGDPGYETARAVWNTDVRRAPLAVVRPATVAGVRGAVRFATDRGLPVAVRGGGHSLAGFGTADDAVVLDLGALADIDVDARARTLTVGGGAVWGQVDEATQRAGLAVTGADVPSVGVGGTTVGGGFGWLHRAAGMTCDNLLSAEVVTAAGETLTAAPDSHSDLYWALRGGGGNYGVVTAFRFRLRPVATVVSGTVLHAFDRAADVLLHYQDVCDRAPDHLALRATLLTAPPAPFVPPELRGGPVVMIGVADFAPSPGSERLIAELRGFGTPAVADVRLRPYLELQQPPGRTVEAMRAHGHSAFLGRLDERLVKVLVETAGQPPSPLAMIQLQLLGGVAGRVPADATPVPHRDAVQLLGVNALAARQNRTAGLAGWTKAAADAVRPYVRGGPYVNFVTGEETADQIRTAYGADTYDRLAAVKSVHDPENVFRFNANIVPRPLRPPNPN